MQGNTYFFYGFIVELSRESYIKLESNYVNDSVELEVWILIHR